MTQDKNLINLSAEQTKEEIEEIPKKETTVKKKAKSKSQSFKTADEKSFRMISKVETQKRKGRYNIYINDDFAFGVDEEVLLKFELKKGLHVTKELQKRIETEDSFYKAYQKTLNYLSYSLRTEKQIKDYLVKNEIDLYTERIVETLKEMKLLDDLNYAESYVRSMANVNRKGPRNIEQDLKQKGVSEHNIMDALEEYPEELQIENAIHLAEKKWAKMRNSSGFESVQKVKQYLVNKGYSFEFADQAIEAIDTEKDTDEEYRALEKQADKAHRRYSRKHEGYQLSQRLRAFIYSKGFSNELINRYFEEREI